MMQMQTLPDTVCLGGGENPGILSATSRETIRSRRQLSTAEIGLAVEREANTRAHPLYPSYCLMTRILELSIDDFLSATSEHLKESEIYFWRESRMFIFYGQLACEMEQILFGRTFTLEDLRRGAERKMGLPIRSLSPSHPMTLQQEQALAVRVRERFAYIVNTVGHVPDPAADRRFAKAKSAKSRRSPLMSVQEELLIAAAG